MRHATDKICGGLHAPLELHASANNSFRYPDSALAVHEEVVVDNPQQFETVASHQIARFFCYLLCWKSVPLTAIHAFVGAVAAVIWTRQARSVHGPSPAADFFIRIEIRQVVRLRWHIDQRPEGTGHVESHLA